MKYPNFEEEKKLWKKGYKMVVGIDEAGRGPLAGPVVAAAVIFNFQFTIYNKFSIKQFSNIKDSKKLTERQREEIYKALINHKDISWGVGIVSEKIIDKINILEATKLAMRRAAASLRAKRSNLKVQIAASACEPPRNDEYLLIDGNFKLNNIDILQKSIIKGDLKVFSIAAASIIAKVTRDRIMQKYHKKYPQYGFNAHKGYGTKAHFANLEKFGACKIHRKTFYPVSALDLSTG